MTGEKLKISHTFVNRQTCQSLHIFLDQHYNVLIICTHQNVKYEIEKHFLNTGMQVHSTEDPWLAVALGQELMQLQS